jgi:biopolymer transport protein ExbD
MSIEHLQTDGIRRIFTGHKSNLTLRMAPMIDMIFLLLIFFLVAAQFRPQESFLPLNLATTYGRTATIKAEPLTISINADTNGCKVQIGQCVNVSIKDASIDNDLVILAEQLADCLRNQNRVASDPVEIICADDVKWDHLAKIYNLLYGMGLSDLTFQLTE